MSNSISNSKYETITRLWSCLYCGLKFDSKMKLKNHGIEAHPLENNYFNQPNCSDCGCIFNNFQNYMRHIENTGHMRHKYRQPSIGNFQMKQGTYSARRSDVIVKSSSSARIPGDSNQNMNDFTSCDILNHSTFSHLSTSINTKQQIRHVAVLFTDKRNPDSVNHFSQIRHFQIPPVRYVMYFGVVIQPNLHNCQMKCAWWLKDSTLTIDGIEIIAKNLAYTYEDNESKSVILLELKSLLNGLSYCLRNRISIIKICGVSESLIQSLRKNSPLCFELEIKCISQKFEIATALLNQFLYYEFECISEYEISIL